LEACREARSDVKDVQSIRESEYRLRKEVDTLKRRLDEYDKKYGIKDPGDDPLHILSAKIAEKDKLIEELQEKCQTSQAVSVFEKFGCFFNEQHAYKLLLLARKDIGA